MKSISLKIVGTAHRQRCSGVNVIRILNTIYNAKASTQERLTLNLVHCHQLQHRQYVLDHNPTTHICQLATIWISAFVTKLVIFPVKNIEVNLH